VQRIAGEAGIARTTFYGHFPDKPTLLVRMTEAVSPDLFSTAEAWVRDGGGRESLTDTVAGLVAAYRRHAPLLRALVEVAGYEPQVEAYWHTRIEVFADSLRARLERDRGGSTSPEIAYTASLIAWGAERSIAVHVADQPPTADAAFTDGIASAVWAAMRPA
jgi:AcrR family transcriptional regulator